MSTDVKSWTDLLSATIKSSRLSGSKTQKLAEDSKSLPAPSESTAVTSFLRLNNSLGQMDKTRINSIYVFDAVARANKGVKGKEAFLGMMEGVVESFVGGLVEDGRGGVWAEGKEKARKMIDIWRKNSTFPPACLERLDQRIKLAAPSASTTPTYPPMSPLGPAQNTNSGGSSGPGPTSPPVAPGSLPPEIQKLLGIQAAAANPSANGAPATGPSGGMDLAAILAGISKPSGSPSTSISTPTPSTIPTPSQPPLAALSAPSLNFDPAQLAALANLAKVQPTLPGLGAAQPLLPNQPNAAYRPPPPSGPPFPPPAGPGVAGPPGVRAGYAPPPTGQGSYAGPSGPLGQTPAGQGYGARRDSREGGGFANHDRRYSEDKRGGGGSSAGGVRPRSRSPSRMRRDEMVDRAEPMGMRREAGANDWNDRERGERGVRGDWHERGDRGGRGRGRGRGRGGWEGHGGDRSGGGWDGHGSRADGPNRPIVSPQNITHPLPFIPPPAARAPPSASSGRVALPLQPGKDEFGRDLPPSSTGTRPDLEEGEEDMALDNSDDESAQPSSSKGNPSTQPTQPPPQSNQPMPTQPSTSHPANPPTLQTQPPRTSHSQPFAPAARAAAPTAQTKTTLQTFDRNTFNPADPASWSALAAAWEGSMGRPPNQFELMQFLATGNAEGMGANDGPGGAGMGMGMGMGVGMNGMGGGGMGGAGMGGMGGTGGLGRGMGGMGMGMGNGGGHRGF